MVDNFVLINILLNCSCFRSQQRPSKFVFLNFPPGASSKSLSRLGDMIGMKSVPDAHGIAGTLTRPIFTVYKEA